jgi:hypothetical protein
MTPARPLPHPVCFGGGRADGLRAIEPTALFQGLVFVWQAAMAAARGVPLGQTVFPVDAKSPPPPSRFSLSPEIPFSHCLSRDAHCLSHAAIAATWDTAFWPSLLRGPG